MQTYINYLLNRSPHTVSTVVAVDFDNLIIHAKTYSWPDWMDVGRHNYPSCQPVTSEFLASHGECFKDFVDMRRFTSIYAK